MLAMNLRSYTFRELHLLKQDLVPKLALLAVARRVAKAVEKTPVAPRTAPPGVAAAAGAGIVKRPLPPGAGAGAVKRPMPPSGPPPPGIAKRPRVEDGASPA